MGQEEDGDPDEHQPVTQDPAGHLTSLAVQVEPQADDATDGQGEGGEGLIPGVVVTLDVPEAEHQRSQHDDEDQKQECQTDAPQAGRSTCGQIPRRTDRFRHVEDSIALEIIQTR